MSKSVAQEVYEEIGYSTFEYGKGGTLGVKTRDPLKTYSEGVRYLLSKCDRNVPGTLEENLTKLYKLSEQTEGYSFKNNVMALTAKYVKPISA